MSVLDPHDWTMEPYERTLSESQLQALGEVLAEWAEVHPRRNRPFMAFVDNQQLTPLDVAEALKNKQSPWHSPVARVFSIGLSGFAGGDDAAFEQTLEVFRRDTRSFRESRPRGRG